MLHKFVFKKKLQHNLIHSILMKLKRVRVYSLLASVVFLIYLESPPTKKF